jgi:hypothetical protein
MKRILEMAQKVARSGEISTRQQSPVTETLKKSTTNSVNSSPETKRVLEARVYTLRVRDANREIRESVASTKACQSVAPLRCSRWRIHVRLHRFIRRQILSRFIEYHLFLARHCTTPPMFVCPDRSVTLRACT